MNRYTYTMTSIGMEEQFSVTVTETKMEHFLAITEDINPLHTDKNYACSKDFPDKVVYGMLTASFYSTLAGVYLPGRYSLIHSVETKFVRPVYVGDLLTVKGTIIEKNDAFQVLTIKLSIVNQDGVKVSRGIMKVGFLDE